MAASSAGASKPQRPRSQRSRRSSFRLTRAERRRSRGDDGRGDLVESPEPAGSHAPQVAGQIETPRPPDPIMRRPRADREEKRVTHGRDMRNEEQLAAGNLRQKGRPEGLVDANPLQCVTITENRAMPRGCKPTGDHVLSNAERQARYRARQQVEAATAVTRPRRPTDRRSRPQRWRDAVGALLTLQAAYAEWLAALPDGLQGSATADALEAIVDLDLTPLADVEPPRGYGRD